MARLPRPTATHRRGVIEVDPCACASCQDQRGGTLLLDEGDAWHSFCNPCHNQWIDVQIRRSEDPRFDLMLRIWNQIRRTEQWIEICERDMTEAELVRLGQLDEQEWARILIFARYPDDDEKQQEVMA